MPVEDREKSLAKLTIQSVGIISIALAVGTAVLYSLAGDFFVHLGPRDYPGSQNGRSSSWGTTGAVERTVGSDSVIMDGGVTGGVEEGGVDNAARRLVERRGNREAFHFEGFPEVGSVRPDF